MYSLTSSLSGMAPDRLWWRELSSEERRYTIHSRMQAATTENTQLGPEVFTGMVDTEDRVPIYGTDDGNVHNT